MKDLTKELIEAIREKDLKRTEELVKEGTDLGILDFESIDKALSALTTPVIFGTPWTELDHYADAASFFMRPDLIFSILCSPEHLKRRVQGFGISGDDICYCDSECLYDGIEDNIGYDYCDDEYLYDGIEDGIRNSFSYFEQERHRNASIHFALDLKNFEAVKILREAGEKFRIPKLFCELASQEFSKKEIAQLKELFKEFNYGEIRVLLSGLAYYSSIDFSKSFLSALIEGSLVNKTLHKELNNLLRRESTENIVNLRKALSSEKKELLSKKKKRI